MKDLIARARAAQELIGGSVAEVIRDLADALEALDAAEGQEAVAWMVSTVHGDEWECHSKLLAERHAANGARVRPYRYARPVPANCTCGGEK